MHVPNIHHISYLSAGAEDNVEFVQERCVTVCALLVLHYNIYNDYDRKVVRLVWDLHKSVSL